MFFWLIYDQNGVLYYPPQVSATNPWPNPPATLTVISFPQDTAPANVVMAYTYPNRFLVQNGALVEQPYFSVSAQVSSGQATLTATLNNPPATPPTSATFTVLGQSISATLTNNVATLTLAIHPSVMTQQVQASVSAAGCAQATVALGGTGITFPLQAYKDSSGNWHIAPTQKAVLQGYYASLVPQQEVAANTLVAVSLLADFVFDVLATPAVVSALSPNQQNAINDFKANILPNLPITSANAYPSGGPKEIHYANFEANMPKYAESVTGYNADVANIPNLV